MILKSAASVVAPAGHQHECPSKSGTTTLASAPTSTARSPAGDADQRAPRRVPIVELNEHLTCFLCKGYFIDATTIIECLHSFCRSCIVKYLESNKYCPVCDVQVHKTKPLLNIRPDKTLQDIVYKLVPKLFQNEMQRRHDFYAQHPESQPSPLETRGEASYQHLLTPDEMLCISLIYHGASDKCTPRYLRCSAAVSIWHLQKLIRNKYDLSVHHRVEILHQEDPLASYLTLMDVAYIYLWRRKVPLALTYRIYENLKRTSSQTHKPISENNNDSADGDGEEGWKEVQLRISENGEMSVTGIQDCLSLLDANILQDDKEIEKTKSGGGKTKETKDNIKASPSKKLKSEKKSYLAWKESKKSSTETKRETRSALQVKNSTAEAKKEEKHEIPASPQSKPGKIKERKRKSEDKQQKEKDNDVETKKSKLDELQSTLPACISITAKPVILNHSLGLQNLSNNHPLKKHSLSTNTKPTTPTVSISNATSVTPSTLKVSTVSSSTIVKSTAAHAMCTGTTTSTYTSSPSMGKNLYPQYPRVYTPPTTNYTPINVPNVANIHANRIGMGINTSQTRQYIPPGQQQQQQLHHRLKTLETKQWTQLRPEVRHTTPPPIASPQPGSTNDLRNVRPAKFFKMRNNMPRYLGCPASGVKPMYHVQDSPEKEEPPPPLKDKEKKSIKDLTKSLKEVAKDGKKDKEQKEKKSTEIKRHSIVKIDPKTLKPITERAPDSLTLTTSNYKTTTSTTTSTNVTSQAASLSPQQDLKINTSSVSIFNPMKLQAERKSPHSPISKRPASSPTIGNLNNSNNSNATGNTTTTNSGIASPIGISMPMIPHHAQHQPKLQKPNLSYTPPNPFVPNLQSPTINPNQFMYPPPAGFPYDPMMAFLAYSRAPFNYDFHKMQMGQMPPYGVQPLVMMSQPQPVSPQQSQASPGTPKKLKESNKEKITSRSSSSPKVDGAKQNELTKDNHTKELKNHAGKELKDASCKNTNATTTTTQNNKPQKSEKSLQNALDKLTKAKMGGGENNTENNVKFKNNKIEITSQITITSQGNITHSHPSNVNESKTLQTTQTENTKSQEVEQKDSTQETSEVNLKSQELKETNKEQANDSTGKRDTKTNEISSSTKVETTQNSITTKDANEKQESKINKEESTNENNSNQEQEKPNKDKSQEINETKEELQKQVDDTTKAQASEETKNHDPPISVPAPATTAIENEETNTKNSTCTVETTDGNNKVSEHSNIDEQSKADDIASKHAAVEKKDTAKCTLN